MCRGHFEGVDMEGSEGETDDREAPASKNTMTTSTDYINGLNQDQRNFLAMLIGPLKFFSP